MSTWKYLVRIGRQLVVNVILHYDSASRDLCAWFWWVFKPVPMFYSYHWHHSRPVDGAGQRVTPSSLLDHRNAYQFRAPCCLCAQNCTTDDYIESAIYITGVGQYSGKYVAGCAFNRCGYLSKLHLSLDIHISCLPILSLSWTHVFKKGPVVAKVSREVYVYFVTRAILLQLNASILVYSCGRFPSKSSSGRAPANRWVARLLLVGHIHDHFMITGMQRVTASLQSQPPVRRPETVVEQLLRLHLRSLISFQMLETKRISTEM